MVHASSRRLAVIAPVAAACFAASADAALPKYTATEFVTLRVPGSTQQLHPWRINDFGQVTGQTTDATEAFLWTPDVRNGTAGSIINLGDLAGGSSLRVAANSINSIGQVVGDSRTSSGQRAAFLWTPSAPNAPTGSMVAIATSPTSANAPVGRGINDYGQVIINRGGGNAALWTPNAPNGPTGSLADIVGQPSPNAYVMNNYGQVSGTISTEAVNHFETYIWTPTAPNPAGGMLTRLGTHVGLPSSAPSGMNDRGQIAGYSLNGDLIKGYLWTPDTPNGATGSFRDFGFDRPSDVNNLGQVVGRANASPGGFIWTQADGLVSLDTLLVPGSNWTIHGAVDINNAGQILAFGTYDPPGPLVYPNDAYVLLTPVRIPGDSDVSGVVNAEDYLLADRGFLANLSGWGNGDFNGDGVVNISDYFLIDRSFAMQGGAAATVGLSQASVPGPSSVVFALGVAGLTASRRCRRR